MQTHPMLGTELADNVYQGVRISLSKLPKNRFLRKIFARPFLGSGPRARAWGVRRLFRLPLLLNVQAVFSCAIQPEKRLNSPFIE